MDKDTHWRYLFAPDSVAVVGASNIPGSWGFGITRNLLASKKSRVYPVSTSLSEVLGVPAHKGVADLPAPVDLAVIAVAASRVSGVFRECVEKGVRAAVIISGGFAETGEEGARLESELVKIARPAGVRFIGPNTMGHVDTSSPLCTLAWTSKITPGPVGLISQSGSFGFQILRNGMNNGIGFSKFVSTGNEADLRFEDYLECLARDGNTRVIAAYVEGLRDGRRFFELSREITRKKPIVVMKSGGTEKAARAVRSHTGNLAGSEAVYTAAFRQAGVISVADDDELCDTLAALLSQPLPRGNRVGILTMWGGSGVVTAEACEKEGLEIAPLEESTLKKLDACLPPRWSHGNPVDMVGINMTDPQVILSALSAMLEDKNVDALVVQAPLPLGKDRLTTIFDACSDEEIEHLEDAGKKALGLVREKVEKYGKPVLIVRRSFELSTDPEVFQLLHQKRISPFTGARRAARMLRRLAWYRRHCEQGAGGKKREAGSRKQGASKK